MNEGNTALPEPTAEDRARARFFTAAGGQPPTEGQRARVAMINESLALTALEDVQMRANRAIFATGPSA